jgi:hypothetical protein
VVGVIVVVPVKASVSVTPEVVAVVDTTEVPTLVVVEKSEVKTVDVSVVLCIVVVKVRPAVDLVVVLGAVVGIVYVVI